MNAIRSAELTRASEEARERLRQTLDLWFPRCVSPDGGFHQAFARDWTPLPEATRFQVFQSRMTWVAAVGAEEFPDRREEFESYVEIGQRGLRDVSRNRGQGGTLWQTDLTGEPTDEAGSRLRTYGTAFQLFAMAASVRALQKAQADFAGQGCMLLLELLHDEIGGGWQEEATFELVPLEGEKLFNTHLHVFEALLEWAQQHPENPALPVRLRELVRLFEGPMSTPSGRMLARFDREWNPISDDWEIGHDLEAAYLLLDSGLGDPENALKTIDYALDHGFDHERGGFFQLGNSKDEIVDDAKVYWTQDEGLNALIAAWKSTGEPKFESALLKQWAWIRDRQWDQEFGGTLPVLTKEGELIGNGQKAEPWKACYHDVRALRNLGNAMDDR